jgi:hypothetical protein
VPAVWQLFCKLLYNPVTTLMLRRLPGYNLEKKFCSFGPCMWLVAGYYRVFPYWPIGCSKQTWKGRIQCTVLCKSVVHVQSLYWLFSTNLNVATIDFDLTNLQNTQVFIQEFWRGGGGVILTATCNMLCVAVLHTCVAMLHTCVAMLHTCVAMLHTCVAVLHTCVAVLHNVLPCCIMCWRVAYMC